MSNSPLGKGTVSNIPRSVIANCQAIAENGRSVTVPLRMADILANTAAVTGDWPRRVGDSLFVPSRSAEVDFLRNETSLFAYFHSEADVHWTHGTRYISKAEFHAELRRTAPSYDAVEVSPHEPPMPRHYYTCGEIEPGNGDHLRQLVDRFSPATEIDRDLITAALVTPGWGGPAGTRPAFCITSDHGRGIGKTTLAEIVGLVWGGVLSFSHREDIGKIKTRLLTPDAMTRRVALVDNVKSTRFSWSEMEGLITSATIGGHRMYVGEGTRPNTLTWFVTLNGASLSTDMAQRCVIVKLDKPARSGSWSDETKAFVEEHRSTIIGDIVGFLRSNAVQLSRFSRWSNWERDVLARLPEPSDAQRVIEERQFGVDVEAEEAATIEDHFADELRRLRYNPDTDSVFIPSLIANQWYNRAQNDRQTTTQTSRLMNQMDTEGRLKRLHQHRTGKRRGFLWTGAEEVTSLHFDLPDRLSQCW